MDRIIDFKFGTGTGVSSLSPLSWADSARLCGTSCRLDLRVNACAHDILTMVQTLSGVPRNPGTVRIRQRHLDGS